LYTLIVVKYIFYAHRSRTLPRSDIEHRKVNVDRLDTQVTSLHYHVATLSQEVRNTHTHTHTHGEYIELEVKTSKLGVEVAVPSSCFCLYSTSPH